ncbi:unnamed protein product [Lota lota]
MSPNIKARPVAVRLRERRRLPRQETEDHHRSTGRLGGDTAEGRKKKLLSHQSQSSMVWADGSRCCG